MPRESKAAKVQRALAIDDELMVLYPGAHCFLDHENPFQLLVATVLSAQTTDARVNTVTPELFERYPDAASLGAAHPEDVEAIVRPLGMYRMRASRIIGLGQGLDEHFGGEVPADLDKLVTLPGVGRKTANVVLGNCFGIPGITVDTHVGRLSRRLGWTRQTDPVKAEKEIGALLPPERWTDACHRLILHGRTICHSRKPACDECPLLEMGLCPQVGV